jgi:hypothetical protein
MSDKVLQFDYNSYTDKGNQIKSMSIPLKKGAVIDLSHLPYGSRFIIKGITEEYVLLKVKRHLIMRTFRGLDDGGIFDDMPLEHLSKFRYRWSDNPFRRGFTRIAVTDTPVYYSPYTEGNSGVFYRLYLRDGQ